MLEYQHYSLIFNMGANMISTKIKWLSSKVSDNKRFYKFINENDKWIVDYISKVCYNTKNLKDISITEELIYKLEEILNDDDLRKNRTPEEIKLLVDKAISILYKKDSFRMDGYNKKKANELLEVIVDKSNLYNCTMEEEYNLITLLAKEPEVSQLYEKDKFRILRIEKNIAVSKDLAVLDKAKLVEFIRMFFDNHSVEMLYILEKISNMNFSDLGDEAYLLKKFMIEKTCYNQINDVNDDVPLLNQFSLFENCQNRILYNIWGSNIVLVYSLIQSNSLQQFFKRLDIIEENKNLSSNELMPLLEDDNKSISFFDDEKVLMKKY